ncbi:MAG: helix-turn-helix transcriptional regulator [Nocardioides sp.]|jgi:DNA-binding NarL/FixJ family response regulator
MASWLPAGYAELSSRSAGHALDLSLLLTRDLAPCAPEIAAEVAARLAAGEPVSVLEYDVAAGAALHAGRHDEGLALATAGLNEAKQLTAVDSTLLRVKCFAAACLVGTSEEVSEHGLWLVAYASEHGDDMVTAIVWSAFAVRRAAIGDAAGVAECRAVLESLELDPALQTTIEGTQGLLALAEATLGSGPAQVGEPWLQSVVAQGGPLMRALTKAARAIGQPLVRSDQSGTPTPRQVEVLRLVRDGATNARIAHELGVAPRTVQSEVAILKRIHGVTNRAALHLPTTLPAPGRPLTPRQRDVVDLIQAGYTNGGISAALGISERTVERHVSDASARLGVVGRTQLAASAGVTPVREATLGV